MLGFDSSSFTQPSIIETEKGYSITPFSIRDSSLVSLSFKFQFYPDTVKSLPALISTDPSVFNSIYSDYFVVRAVSDPFSTFTIVHVRGQLID